MSDSDETRMSQVVHSHEIARASYNRLSRWYDTLAGQRETRLVELALEKFAAVEGETILEIGFGTGTALIALARSVGNTGTVFGVDISDGMLAIASGKAQRAGIWERVNLQRSDAEHLEYEEGQFDGIFMSFTLELFDPVDIPLVLWECHRVLRKESISQPDHPAVRMGTHGISKGNRLPADLRSPVAGRCGFLTHRRNRCVHMGIAGTDRPGQARQPITRGSPTFPVTAPSHELGDSHAR